MRREKLLEVEEVAETKVEEHADKAMVVPALVELAHV